MPGLNLCILEGGFNEFMFLVIIYIFELVATILLSYFYLFHIFGLSFFFIFYYFIKIILYFKCYYNYVKYSHIKNTQKTKYAAQLFNLKMNLKTTTKSRNRKKKKSPETSAMSSINH